MVSGQFLAMIIPVGAYLLGAVPFALLLGKLAGVDLRTTGSGNIGAGNLTQTVGIRPGVVAAILDLGKGLAPVMVARSMGLEPGLVIFSGVSAVIGHNWSIFLRGRAGRGLATSAGVVLAMAPILVLWLGGWAMAGWRIGGGRAGFIGWGLVPIFAMTRGLSPPIVLGATALTVLMMGRRIQGNPGRVPGVRAGLRRAVYDTDPVTPELTTADQPITA